MAERRPTAIRVIAVGIVFMALSAVTAAWHLVHDQPIDLELPLFVGGVIVTAIGAALARRQTR